jgi:hypothetical protein
MVLLLENIERGHGPQRHDGAHAHAFERARSRIGKRGIIIHKQNKDRPTHDRHPEYGGRPTPVFSYHGAICPK